MGLRRTPKGYFRELAPNLTCQALGVFALTASGLAPCVRLIRRLSEALDDRPDLADLGRSSQPFRHERSPRWHAPIMPGHPRVPPSRDPTFSYGVRAGNDRVSPERSGGVQRRRHCIPSEGERLLAG